MSRQGYEDSNSRSATWTELDAVMQSYVDQGKVAGMTYLVQQGETSEGPWECAHPEGAHRQNPVYMAV